MIVVSIVDQHFKHASLHAIAHEINPFDQAELLGFGLLSAVRSLVEAHFNLVQKTRI